MQTVVLVVVVGLSGFLVNKLSDRYDFPLPDWVLWAALIGLGWLYELKDRLPQQLTAQSVDHPSRLRYHPPVRG